MYERQCGSGRAGSARIKKPDAAYISVKNYFKLRRIWEAVNTEKAEFHKRLDNSNDISSGGETAWSGFQDTAYEYTWRSGYELFQLRIQPFHARVFSNSNRSQFCRSTYDSAERGTWYVCQCGESTQNRVDYFFLQSLSVYTA